MANLKRIILGIYAALCVLSLAYSDTVRNDRKKRSINGVEVQGESLLNNRNLKHFEPAPSQYTFRVSMINYGSDPVKVSQHNFVPDGVEIRSFTLETSSINETRHKRSADGHPVGQATGGTFSINGEEKGDSEMTYINHPGEIAAENVKTFHKLSTTILVHGDNVVGGEISTPNYPENYPDGADISWLIIYPKNNIVRLDIIDYSMEECCDHLLIYDGVNKSAPVLGTVDGEANGHSPSFYSTGRSVFLRFTSDCLLSDKGFQASYINEQRSNPVAQTTVPSPMTCGSVQLESGNTGFVSSPNYPGHYGNDMSCTWSVETHYGTRVKFTIEDFYTQSYDILYIYNGSPNNPGNLVRTLSGSVYAGYTVTVNSNKAFLIFNTSSSTTYSGFNISYEGVYMDFETTASTYTSAYYFSPQCSGIQQVSPSTNIYSPGWSYPQYYPEYVNCQWRVQVPNGYVVRLYSYYFSLGSSDYVRFYNGYSTSSYNMIAQFTGYRSPNTYLAVSTSRQATLSFQSNGYSSGRGFNMKFISLYSWTTDETTWTPYY